MNKNNQGVIHIILIFLVLLLGIVGFVAIRTKFNPPQLPPNFNFTEVTNKFSYLQEGHSRDKNTVKIEIIHDKSKPTSLNDEFLITEDTHITVTVYYAPTEDCGGETIFYKNFTGVKKLPFQFEITGDLDKTFIHKPSGELDIIPKYYVSAKVINNPSFDPVVGDLVSEYKTSILAKENKDVVELKVFGLEECGSPNAGGYCTTRTKI